MVKLKLISNKKEVRNHKGFFKTFKRLEKSVSADRVPHSFFLDHVDMIESYPTSLSKTCFSCIQYLLMKSSCWASWLGIVQKCHFPSGENIVKHQDLIDINIRVIRMSNMIVDVMITKNQFIFQSGIKWIDRATFIFIDSSRGIVLICSNWGSISWF